MFVHQALRKLARENKMSVAAVRRIFGEYKTVNRETTKQALRSTKVLLSSEVVSK